MTEKILNVEVSPHIQTKSDVRSIMRDVIISLLPALAASVMFFGLKMLLLVFVSIATCVVSEYIFCRFSGRKPPIGDLSAVVTAILFVFVLPPSLPVWMVVIGGVVAIILGKQIFGGLGYNPFNPALISRAVLLASWPVQMTSWVRPFDGVSCASPLGIVKMQLTDALPSQLEMFFGNRAGCIGETSALALLLGAAYLLARRHITLHVPLAYVGTVFAVSVIFKLDPLFNIMAGGLILGAFFMATDMVTSPMTGTGKVIYGLCCGLLTMLIRYKGGFPEGVCYAILIMNIAVPLLDRFTEYKPFGYLKKS